MLTLIVFIVGLFGGSYVIYNIRNKHADKFMLIYACLFLTLFCGLIDAKDFGTDIMNYYNNAESALDVKLSSYLERGSFESGYKVFTWLTVNLFRSAQIFLIVQALFVNGTVCFFIYKNSKNAFIGLVTYVCFGTFLFYFTAFRQGIAMAICLYAIMLIKNRHRILAIPVILFATLFHQTAVVFLPLILIRDLKINTLNLVLTFAVALVIGLFLDRILLIINEEFDMDYGKQGSESAVGGIMNLVIFSLCFVMFYFMNKNKVVRLYDAKTDYRNFYIYIGLIATVLYAVRFYALAVERVAFYFVPIFTVLYGEVFANRIKEKDVSIIKIFFIMLSIALFAWRFYSFAIGYKTVL